MTWHSVTLLLLSIFVQGIGGLELKAKDCKLEHLATTLEKSVPGVVSLGLEDCERKCLAERDCEAIQFNWRTRACVLFIGSFPVDVTCDHSPFDDIFLVGRRSLQKEEEGEQEDIEARSFCVGVGAIEKFEMKHNTGPMTRNMCRRLCQGYGVMALLKGDRCGCGSSIRGDDLPRLDSSECQVPCEGNAAQYCGGMFGMSVESLSGENAGELKAGETQRSAVPIHIKSVSTTSSLPCCGASSLVNASANTYWSSAVMRSESISPGEKILRKRENEPALEPTKAPFGEIHSGHSGVQVPEFPAWKRRRLLEESGLDSGGQGGPGLFEPQSIVVAPDNPSQVVWYTISIVREYLDNAPLDWWLLGSDNLFDWWILDYRLEFSWNETDSFTFKVNIPVKFAYYRLLVTESNPYSIFKTVIVDQVYFYGFYVPTSAPTRAPTALPTLLPTDSSDSILKDGSGSQDGSKGDPNQGSSEAEKRLALNIGLASFGISLALILVCTIGLYVWYKRSMLSEAQHVSMPFAVEEFPRPKRHSGSSKSSASAISAFLGFGKQGEKNPSFVVHLHDQVFSSGLDPDIDDGERGFHGQSGFQSVSEEPEEEEDAGSVSSVL